MRSAVAPAPVASFCIGSGHWAFPIRELDLTCKLRDTSIMERHTSDDHRNLAGMTVIGPAHTQVTASWSQPLADRPADEIT